MARRVMVKAKANRFWPRGDMVIGLGLIPTWKRERGDMVMGQGLIPMWKRERGCVGGDRPLAWQVV